jgi:hypothetical protein
MKQRLITNPVIKKLKRSDPLLVLTFHYLIILLDNVLSGCRVFFVSFLFHITFEEMLFYCNIARTFEEMCHLASAFLNKCLAAFG